MSEDLSILSWNVRGLNDAAHRELVRETTVCARPFSGVPSGNENQFHEPVNPSADTLGERMAGHCTLDANGTRGGILLAWNQDAVQLTDVVANQLSVMARVRMLISDACFSLTTCYGPTDDRRKEEFLQEMISSKPPAGTPWLIMGDFNLIYKASDKNNLNLNRRLMGKFRAALDDCELMAICLQNRKFTWSNERENLLVPKSPARVSRPLTIVADHTHYG